MQSLKQAPIADTANLTAAPSDSAASPETMPVANPKKPDAPPPPHENKEPNESVGDQTIEPTVTDETDDVKVASGVNEARDDSDDKAALLANTSCAGEGTRKNSDESADEHMKDDGNVDTSTQNQFEIAAETNDSEEDEEPVTPHDLKSINHNILARFMAAPFHARAMHLLHTHKDDKEWNGLLPQLNIPILSQKRCIAVMRKNRLDADKQMETKKQSPWRALSGHNKDVLRKNPQDMPAQNFMNHPQFQQQNRGVQNFAQILQTNSFPLQFCGPNQSNTVHPMNAHPTVMHNPTHAPNIQQFNGQYSAPTNYAPIAGFPHPQFFPSGFNNSYINNYQLYQLAQAQNAAQSTTAPIPQAMASKPITLNESNKQPISKLPVAFGFYLNNEHSHLLAHSAAQTWSQQGTNALKKKTPKKTKKVKTPRKSPSTTPNKSPRMSPVLIPTTEQKKKGLPEGWTTKTYQRLGGTTVGQSDTYFYSPITNIKFRSKNKIKIFVEIVNEVGGDEKRAFKLFKERGHRV